MGHADSAPTPKHRTKSRASPRPAASLAAPVPTAAITPSAGAAPLATASSSTTDASAQAGANGGKPRTRLTTTSDGYTFDRSVPSITIACYSRYRKRFAWNKYADQETAEAVARKWIDQCRLAGGLPAPKGKPRARTQVSDEVRTQRHADAMAFAYGTTSKPTDGETWIQYCGRRMKSLNHDWPAHKQSYMQVCSIEFKRDKS